MGKKPIVSVTYEIEKISIKNRLTYLKCVLRLSYVVHGPIYGVTRSSSRGSVDGFTREGLQRFATFDSLLVQRRLEAR